MADKPARRRRRSMEMPYSRITEIREAITSDEANELLNGGFVLIKAVEKRETDALGRQASSIVYVLGKMRENGTKSTPPAKPEQPDGNSILQDDLPTVDPALLESRPWKAYSQGEGEWTLAYTQDGTLVPELEPAREFMVRLKDGDDLVVGGYKYRLRDKFLKRYSVNGRRE
jgi:hypothetical protein